MPLTLPTDEQKKDYRYIYNRLMDYKENKNADSLAKAVSRMVKDETAALTIKQTVGVMNTIQDLEKAAWVFLQTLLVRRDYFSAALVLWGQDAFTPEPRAMQLVFEGLHNHNLINVLGAGSTGKTFGASAFCLLDWLLDPEWTRVQVASNSEDHVKKNLFGDIVRLHRDASMVLPGIVDTESISLDKKSAQGIFVLTIPGGPTAKGKLKGAKIKARPQHPLFGTSSRLRVILDEAQEIPANIYDEIPNLLSSVEEGDTEHIKIYCAANPKDEWSRYGLNSRPEGGWDSLNPEAETWTSSNGWHCIRINAMRTENVVMRKTIFKRMITWEGVQRIIKSAGGDDQHPLVWSLVYGMFPPNGNMTSIIASAHLRNAEGEWIFNGPTQNYAAFDPAFTGDQPAFATGRVGKAVAWESFDGQRHDLESPITACQIDAICILPRGDTQDLANEVLSRCAQLNISPERFGIDRTGTGIGVHDIICRQWREKAKTGDFGATRAPIYGINYAQSPTEVKVCEEDSQTPKDLYDRICSELWYAAAKLFEYGYVKVGRAVEPTVYEEWAARRGGSKVGQGKKQSVEGKDDYKSRTGKPSPDRADAANMLLHVMRCSNPDLVPKAKDTKEEKTEPSKKIEPWHGFELAFGASTMQGFGDESSLPDMLKD